jgi:glycosyltransferase involved in cell wall biosynthesis
MKTLFVLSPEHKHPRLAEQQQREDADQCSQSSLLEVALNADIMDGQYLQNFLSRSLLTRHFLKLLPRRLLQALIVYQQRHRYDVVVSWDDSFALLYAFLLVLTRSRSRHVAILSWMPPLKKALPLKLVQKGIDRIILWSQTQRDLLIEFAGISPARIVALPYFVDHTFWRPMKEVVDSICSVGDSRRDYATLVEAMHGLNIRCNIATRVKFAQADNPDWNATSRSLMQIPDLPNNVVCESASLTELRHIYAHARFVVIPVFPTFRDSGITVLTQAMAMGKAIICTRIPGLTEFLEDGVTGLSVPPGDPQALREAIQYLWDHPDVAERMGRAARQRAEEIFTLTQFVINVRQIVDDVMTENRTPIPTLAEQMHALHKRTTDKPAKETIGSYTSKNKAMSRRHR